MASKSKGKEKTLIEEEEIALEWEEDVDVAIDEAIYKVTGTKKAKRSLREVIASITTEQPATTTPTPATTKITPTKYPASTPKASNKRKRAQPFRGTAAT